jgi:hypothetical protein
MTKNEGKTKTRMLTRNHKIASSNKGVEKAHWKHQGRYVGREKFLFPTIISRSLGLNALDITFTSQSKAVFLFLLGLLEWCGAKGASNFLDFGVCSMFPSCSASSQNYSAICSH